jgi:hypothetical protein
MHTFTFYIYSEAVKDTNIYLYVNPERALILPEGQASVPTDALWGYLEKHLDKGKCVKL